MVPYQSMYTTLFNAITDALQQMEQANYGLACDILIEAQRKTEDDYLCTAGQK